MCGEYMNSSKQAADKIIELSREIIDGPKELNIKLVIEICKKAPTIAQAYLDLESKYEMLNDFYADGFEKNLDEINRLKSANHEMLSALEKCVIKKARGSE